MLDGKKSSIILVLKTLEEYSDEDHYLTQQVIIDKIEANYGMSLERKSVSDCLTLLEKLGYDIVKNPRSGGGYALYSRLFEPSEVQFLTDALFSSRALPAKRALDLSKKAQSVLSVHQRKNYSYIIKSPKLSRTSSDEVFYAIETVHEGMNLGKRISFQYKGYDEHGKECLNKGGFRYIVSPYYLVSNNGFYYLLCNYREKYQPIHVFRVDRMTNLQIEQDWPIKPIETLQGIGDFDIAEYLNEHIYMLGGNTIDATLRIDRPQGIQYLRDWFGDKARIREKDGVLQAKLKCNENALFYWLMQYGDDFTALEPDHLVTWIREYAQRQIDKYGGTKP